MTAKILVVDDEPQLERLIRQRFRKKIKSAEYEFSFAQNGPEALEILSQNGGIDIVLTDINMPKMDGLTFLTKLDELNKQLKAVMVSAYGDMKNIRIAMNRGAYDFVTKPIDFEDLELTINKAIKDLELLKIAQKAQKDLIHIRQELNIASDIQQSILPKNFNIFPGDSHFEISARMIPANDIGGDFYDFFILDDKHLGIVIADVSGKGMPAAIFMAISRTLLKALATNSKSPNECLNDVNYLLTQDNPKSMFVTLFYGILNTETGELEYSNGGHNSPFVVNETSEIKMLNHCSGCALGVTADIDYKSDKIDLKPGNSLVLYTDGIPEAINGREEVYSINRFTSVFKDAHAKSCNQMIQNVIGEFESFTGGVPRSDDITVMVIKYNQ